MNDAGDLAFWKAFKRDIGVFDERWKEHCHHLLNLAVACNVRIIEESYLESITQFPQRRAVPGKSDGPALSGTTTRRIVHNELPPPPQLDKTVSAQALGKMDAAGRREGDAALGAIHNLVANRGSNTASSVASQLNQQEGRLSSALAAALESKEHAPRVKTNEPKADAVMVPAELRKPHEVFRTPRPEELRDHRKRHAEDRVTVEVEKNRRRQRSVSVTRRTG